ncbi:hypothetical protein HMI55_004723, partial [Coelomomyces lativittatus]
SAEAKLVAANLATTQALWFRRALLELKLLKLGTLILINLDGQGAINLELSGVASRHIKHIKTQYFFITNHISRQTICLEDVHSKFNHKDILT